MVRSELAKVREQRAGKFLRRRRPMTSAEIAVSLLIEAARKHGAAMASAIAAKAAKESAGRQASKWKVMYLAQLALLEAQSTLFKELRIPHGNVDQEAHALRGRISRADVSRSTTPSQSGLQQGGMAGDEER